MKRITSIFLLAFVLVLPALAAGQDSAALSPSIQALLAASDRSEADRARDAGRRPARVLEILGVGPGMQVMDVIAAGGWYTEVLSHAVGPEGKVYAQNPPAVLRFRDGANDKALTARLADGRLANVQRLDMEIQDVSVAPGSLDAAITALNLHDIYNRNPEGAVGFLKNIRRLLKPGGVFGVIDHIGSPGANNAELHRMEKSAAIELLEAAGFEIVEDSDLLANPEDDHAKAVFAPGIRGKTDRFLIKAINPA